MVFAAGRPRVSARVRSTAGTPAGLDPAGLDPAGLDPAGLDPAGLDRAGRPGVDTLAQRPGVTARHNGPAQRSGITPWYDTGRPAPLGGAGRSRRSTSF
ncbi:hypothetical protein FLW53_30900 [Microbispora sp. SCL1-1]|nr:hypothetical protein FLW53_30900 [Microbispora sp. SCL1-1]